MRRSNESSSHPQYRSQGLTMIELIMMLVLIAILAAIGIPRYGRSLALYRAQAAAARVAADINFARTRARTSSLGQSIVFNVATNSYNLPGMTGLAEYASLYQVDLTKDPYAATLLTASFSSSTTLTFDRYGQPSAGGTVTLQSGAMTASVAIDASTGLASVQ